LRALAALRRTTAIAAMFQTTGSICSNGPIDLRELFCAAFQDFQIGIVESAVVELKRATFVWKWE
jgi:hypothetical protein